MKQAIFRLDAGKKNGMGHLMRCRALADALHAQGVACTFACKIIDSEICLSPHRLHSIENEDEFLAISKSYQWIIVDHYEYSSEELYVLHKHPDSHLIVLDDMGNRGHLYADIIINPLAKARAFTSYQLSSRAQLLLGPEYCLLGESFQTVKLPAFETRNRIVITFGGSDVAGLTLPVIKAVADYDAITSYRIVVVTGAACADGPAIEKHCEQQHYQYRHNVQNMAELFSTARLAISAAGSTIFELACCAVPSVFAVVADNQWLAAREHSLLGWCRSVDCRKVQPVNELLQQAELLLTDNNLEQYSQTARKIVDAKGAGRVASRIIDLHNA